MNFRDISLLIDMLIGLLENAIHLSFKNHTKKIIDTINTVLATYDNDRATKYIELEQLKLEIKRLNTEHYKVIQDSIERYKVLSYIHTKTPSEFLLSQMTDDDIKSLIGNYDELLKHLDSEVDEYKLSTIVSNHINKLTDELSGVVTSNALNDIDNKQTLQAVEHTLDKYKRHAQNLANLETGKAQSQANIDVDEENKEKYKLRKIWISQRDKRVRETHIILDATEADKGGLFHSKPTQTKGPAPRMMKGALAMRENAGCRCSIGYRVNGIELQQMDKNHMSKEHQALYERTKFDRYQIWLDKVSENIHPAYYEQLSKGIDWDRKQMLKKKKNTVRDDATKFKEMLENGYHKKADGSWGY